MIYWLKKKRIHSNTIIFFFDSYVKVTQQSNNLIIIKKIIKIGLLSLPEIFVVKVFVEKCHPQKINVIKWQFD